MLQCVEANAHVEGTSYTAQHSCSSHDWCHGRSLKHPRQRLIISRASSNNATSPHTRTDALRRLLDSPGILLGPCAHDGLSARLIEKAGFPVAFVSGFGVSAARLGAPDANLLSYSEVLDQGRAVHEATRAIPIIGDGDTGYGNAVNVKRTVRGFAAAGFAGILIEDQVAPKSCGHVKGRRVVSRGEALARIRAAVDARDEGADILIAARTDARQAESLEEAIWRVAAFADAGADILFVDALESADEMRALCSAGGAAAQVPKMANMLEGGGRTPLLSPAELEGLGYKIVAYPLSLLGVSIRAMQGALASLKEGRVPGGDALPSFGAIQEAVGFPEYYAEAARYTVHEPSGTSATSFSSGQAADEHAEAAPSADKELMVDFGSADVNGAPSDAANPVSSDRGKAVGSLDQEFCSLASDIGEDSDAAPARNGSVGQAGQGAREVVEPDAIVLSTSERQQGGGGASEDPGSMLRRARFLRVKVEDASSGAVKLETRLPTAFLDGIAAIIPQVAGVDLEALIGQTKAGWTRDQPLADFSTGSDRVQIFIDGLGP